MRLLICPILALLAAISLHTVASGLYLSHAAQPTAAEVKGTPAETVEKTAAGNSVTTTKDASGAVTSRIEKDSNGYLRSKEYFANGAPTLKITYGADCLVGGRQWKPELAHVTVFGTNGKAAYKQSWSCNDKGVIQTLLHADECDANGRALQTWRFGPGNKPVSVQTWLQNPSRLVSEELNDDGTVKERTTYQRPNQPLRESFTGNQGGTRIINPKFTTFPSNLVTP